MANTAHLTGTVSSNRPSIFEILSHDGFAKALKPAVYHVAKVAASSRPNDISILAYRYFDELYLAFDALVQWYYVLTRGATFSEAFYGLERKLISSDQKLSRIRISYLLSVVLPYLSSKLDKAHSSYLEETQSFNSSNQVSEPKKPTWYRVFLHHYLYFKTAVRITNIFYLLAYAFEKSEHPSLVFKLLDMTLGYTSPERSQFVQSKISELWMLSNWSDPKKLPKLILRSLGESIFLLVEVGTFFVQFLEWWYNDEKRAKITNISSQFPPAPQSLKKDGQIENLLDLSPADMNKCPLCRKALKNPTVISVSGVAYCYGCIFSVLKTEGKCPLTGLPCTTNQLIRIYL